MAEVSAENSRAEVRVNADDVKTLVGKSAYEAALEGGLPSTVSEEDFNETLGNLPDYAEHAADAEAYAKGTVGGTPVSPGQTGYHDNAKYYKEQAAEAAASLELDDTLSVSGKAADAKAVGDKMGMPLNLMSKLATTISGTSAQHIDLDDYTTAGNYRITSANAAGTIDHLPDTKAGRLLVMTTTASTNILQVYICHVSTVYRIYVRSKNGADASWSDWARLLSDNLVDTEPTENSTHLLTSGGAYAALAGKVDAEENKGLSANDFTDELKDKLAGIVNATSSESGLMPAEDKAKLDGIGVPLDLKAAVAQLIVATAQSPDDLDNYTTAGNYKVDRASYANNIAHMPDTKSGRLIVMTTSASAYIMQIYICHVSTVFRLYVRSKNGSDAAWSEWVKLLASNLVDSEPVENSTHLITSGGVFSSINPKSYTVTEADRVADKVRKVQTGTSLTFLSISDLHCILEDETSTGSGGETVEAAPVLAALDDMRQGVKAVLNQLHVDYCVCFGDLIYRMSGFKGFDKGAAEMIAATKIINDAFGTHKQLRLVGNHDPNAYDDTRHYTTAQLNAFFGAYSEDLVKDLYPYGSFGYKDFETQKVRLIVLNTSFYGPNTSISQNSTVYKIGNNEALWLAQHLDLSAKEDAEDWQIVIFSHVPLDIVGSSYKALGKYSAIIDAYFKGSEWVSTSDYRYDFAGKNTAKLALYVNGHAHRYRVQNFLNVNSSGAVANTTELAQLFIANALPGRDSESVDGQTYTKTPNTAQSTAFQVVTIDFENKIAWAHHFGAGIDMMVHYEPSTNASLSTDLTSPTWFSVDSSIATVSGGTVTPVAAGNVMIGAKSSTDGMIEFWNFISEV